MAEDIEFHLKTTGDPKGAEEVEKSIFKADGAAKEASRQADVDIVKRKQLAEEERRHADQLREIADIQQRILAGQLAQELGKIGSQLKGISPEVDLLIGSADNFLNILATTGDPIKATMAVAATAIDAVMDAYRGAAAQAKELSKQEQEDLKRFAEMRQNLASQLRAENLAAFFEREASAIDKAADALERQARIAKAQREANAAVADAFGGGRSDTEQIQTELNRKLTEIEAELVKLRGLADLATTKANTADATAQLTATNEGAESPAAKQAAAAAQEARNAAEQAQNRVAEFTAVSESQKQILFAGAAKEFQSLGTDVAAKLAEQAEAAKKTLEQAAQEQGDKFAAGGKAAIEKLIGLLADGRITPDEIAQMQNAIEQGRVSQIGLNKMAADALGQMRDNTVSLKGIMEGHLSDSKRIWREIENLKQQMASPR